MNIEEIIRELDNVINKYTDKQFNTCELNYVSMAKSCKYKLEEQNQEIERLNNIINKIFEFMQDKYDNSNFTGFTISFMELQDLKDLLKEGKE